MTRSIGKGKGPSPAIYVFLLAVLGAIYKFRHATSAKTLEELPKGNNDHLNPDQKNEQEPGPNDSNPLIPDDVDKVPLKDIAQDQSAEHSSASRHVIEAFLDYLNDIGYLSEEPICLADSGKGQIPMSKALVVYQSDLEKIIDNSMHIAENSPVAEDHTCLEENYGKIVAYFSSTLNIMEIYDGDDLYETTYYFLDYLTGKIPFSELRTKYQNLITWFNSGVPEIVVVNSKGEPVTPLFNQTSPLDQSEFGSFEPFDSFEYLHFNDPATSLLPGNIVTSAGNLDWTTHGFCPIQSIGNDSTANSSLLLKTTPNLTAVQNNNYQPSAGIVALVAAAIVIYTIVRPLALAAGKLLTFSVEKTKDFSTAENDECFLIAVYYDIFYELFTSGSLLWDNQPENVVVLSEQENVSLFLELPLSHRELSSFQNDYHGHSYFTLKDENFLENYLNILYEAGEIQIMNPNQIQTASAFIADSNNISSEINTDNLSTPEIHDIERHDQNLTNQLVTPSTATNLDIDTSIIDQNLQETYESGDQNPVNSNIQSILETNGNRSWQDIANEEELKKLTNYSGFNEYYYC